jgi:hypothetical protein
MSKFLSDVVYGFAFGCGLTIAWHVVGALLDFLAAAVP